MRPKTGSLPRNGLAFSATGGASPVSPSWVISALRAAFGGCAPKRACGRSPAHTLHPQGVCSIRRAAKPLTAALPYRRGKFTTLSTVSLYRICVKKCGSRRPRSRFFCVSERPIRSGQGGAFSAYLFCTKLKNLPFFFLLQLLQKMKCGQKSC